MAGTGVCPICHCNKLPCHVPTQCPLLAELNLKLIKCNPVASSPSSSAPPQCLLPSPMLAPTPSGRAAATDTSSATGSLGSSSALSGLTAAVALAVPPPGNFDLDDEYHWEGNDVGVDYAPPPKVNTRVVPYSPSCSHVCLVPSLSRSALSPHPQAQQPHLLSALQHLLAKLSLSPIVAPLFHGCLVVANTGATDHMVPDKSCFVSYKSMSGLSVRMGNNSYVPVLGCGTAIFALNSKRLLVRNVLHVPGLAVPLYSLCTHFTQQGYGFLGTKESCFLIYFPTFVLSVDTAVDCHLSFDPLDHSAPLNTLHYVQLWCPPSTYPSKISPTFSAATPSPASPAVVEDNDNVPHLCMAMLPIQALSMPSNNINMGAFSTHLKDLADTVHCLTLPTQQPPQSSSTPLPSNPDAKQPSDTSTTADKPVTCLLSTMTSEEIACHLHHPGTSFSLVWPCNTVNASDTKTHWSAEELYCIMGCCKFRNYKHLLQVS
jgi:hypothetical protein